MEVLFHLNDVSLLLLGTACLSAMALQGAHLFVLALWRESPMRVGTLVYEALLMVHLLLASVILREACANYAYVSLWSRSFCVPAIDASWVNVAPVLWGTILALVARRPIMVAELVVMACWLPPFVWLLGSAWPWVVAIGVAFMTSRSLACVALDYRRGGELVTRFSLAEVVNTAQEGILCYKADGRILVMNDAMRGLLETLGCRSVLVDACEVRRILLSDAREIHECMLDANGDVGEAWITAPNSTRWRLVFDVVRLGMGMRRRSSTRSPTCVRECMTSSDSVCRFFTARSKTGTSLVAIWAISERWLTPSWPTWPCASRPTPRQT